MITKQERTKLRSLAQNIEPTVWVGKEGFSENVYKVIAEELFNHELIKIALNPVVEKPTFEQMAEIGAILSCDVVCLIGKKLVLYKPSNKKGIKHIL